MSTRTSLITSQRRSSVGAFAIAAVALGAAMGSGCGGQGSGINESEGEVTLAITTVPGDVNCIQVSAQGKDRLAVRSFIVGPDMSSLFAHVTGLPLGAVTFSGQAFVETCDAITVASNPNWASDPVLASVVAGQVGTVTLNMHRNGAERVAVDFPNEPICSAEGDVCVESAECCGKSCIAGKCQSVPVCESDGTSCKLDTDCCSSACSSGVCGKPTPPPVCSPGGTGCEGESCCDGFSCVTGFCVPTPPVCKPPPFNCVSKDECCPLNGCVGGVCSPICLPPFTPCASDDNCCSGLVCRGFTCVPNLP